MLTYNVPLYKIIQPEAEKGLVVEDLYLSSGRLAVPDYSCPRPTEYFVFSIHTATQYNTSESVSSRITAGMLMLRSMEVYCSVRLGRSRGISVRKDAKLLSLHHFGSG